MILLDDMMPKMSGVETLKHLKEIDGFNVPTIALTANAIPGMREHYLSCGFNDYLAKPIEKEQLIQVMNQVLGRSATEDINVGEVVKAEENIRRYTYILLICLHRYGILCRCAYIRGGG